MSDKPQRRTKKTFSTLGEFARLGINPLEGANNAIKELDELKKEAMQAFKSMRGFGEQHDAGTQYLATAARCISEKANIYLKLAKFKHPELKAIAIKDMTEMDSYKQPMSTKQAVDVLRNDPFASESIKTIPVEAIITAMDSPMDAPLLPIGKKE